MGLTPDSLPVDFKHELDDYEDGYTECERDDVYYLRNVVFVVSSSGVIAKSSHSLGHRHPG